MFFSRRRWALRLTERAELAVMSSVTNEIVSMIVGEAKELAATVRAATNTQLDDAELVLICASGMASNNTARDRLVKTCNLSAVEATAILDKLCDACRELAIEYDYKSVVSKVDEMAGQRRTLARTPSSKDR